MGDLTVGAADPAVTARFLIGVTGSLQLGDIQLHAPNDDGYAVSYGGRSIAPQIGAQLRFRNPDVVINTALTLLIQNYSAYTYAEPSPRAGQRPRNADPFSIVTVGPSCALQGTVGKWGRTEVYTGPSIAALIGGLSMSPEAEVDAGDADHPYKQERNHFIFQVELGYHIGVRFAVGETADLAIDLAGKGIMNYYDDGGVTTTRDSWWPVELGVHLIF
ncbi:MAG: hypothetical protein HY696_04675 [Deltaproteobacteria bacterium]|nr:hypothetical protein [Deltaproteobacteria bacterium]